MHVILFYSFFQHVAQLKWMLLPTIFFQRLITRGLVGWPYRFSTSSFYQLSNIHHPGASLKTAPHTSLQREKTNAILNENQREPWYSGWVDLPVGGFGRWWWYEVGWIYQYSRGWLVVEGYMGGWVTLVAVSSLVESSGLLRFASTVGPGIKGH